MSQFFFLFDAWSQLSKENIIKSSKCCNSNLANDSTEDDFIHCLKKGAALRSWKVKAELSAINFS